MPTKHLNKLAENGLIKVRVCRLEKPDSACTQAGAPLQLAPGATGTFSEMLPEASASGTPRPFYYAVELLERKGRPTGTSNTVPTLAGSPLPPIRGLTAEKTSNGVLLRWESAPDLREPAGTIIRIHRVRLITMPTIGDGTASQPEEHVLEIQDRTDLDHVLDTTAHNDDSYEYRVQRVVQMTIGGQPLELASELSIPVDIHMQSSER